MLYVSITHGHFSGKTKMRLYAENLYGNADLPSKKMIINNLLKRIDVYRGYRLHIEPNFSSEHFSKGTNTDPESLKSG